MWNAARVLSEYIDAEPEHVRDKNVLELGAGAALPSIVAALNGARCVWNATLSHNVYFIGYTCVGRAHAR